MEEYFFLNWANSWKEYCPDCISTESQKMQMLVQYQNIRYAQRSIMQMTRWHAGIRYKNNGWYETLNTIHANIGKPGLFTPLGGRRTRELCLACRSQLGLVGPSRPSADDHLYSLHQSRERCTHLQWENMWLSWGKEIGQEDNRAKNGSLSLGQQERGGMKTQHRTGSAR
jgi:hypothetical protein